MKRLDISFGKFSVKDLKKRIWITIVLVTILPLIVLLCYQFNRYIDIPPLALFVLGIILFLGWVIIIDSLLLSVLKIYLKSKSTLQDLGETKLMEELYIKNEMESLESVFNLLSSKVKRSFEELKAMSGQIEDLNQKLARKVGILSVIMQTQVTLSKGEYDESILQFIADKLKEVFRANRVIVVLKRKKIEGFDFVIFPSMEASLISQILDARCLEALSRLEDKLIIDKEHKGGDYSFLKDIFGFKNIFVNPLHLKEELIGYLIGGNNLDDFVFLKDDLELIELFSKNITLIWEHKRLSAIIEDLEILDSLTGLYNAKYIKNRLEEEIKRAVIYQRPCGLLLLELTNYKELQDRFGMIEVEKLLKRIAKIFKEPLRPIDIPGRVEEDKMAAILIERNKRQCQEVTKDISRALNSYFEKEKIKPRFLFSVAENPVDGSNAEELFKYASSNLKEL
jgi:diguanylate cyclase (GGDEF)-like protein